MIILGGDIGGTNCRLALFEHDQDRLRLLEEHKYSSADHPRLGAIMGEFLATTGARCDAAGLGVPGPVRDRRARLTNLPWVVDGDQLEEELGIDRVVLLNDLEAAAAGVEDLEDSDFLVLQPGRPNPVGVQAVIAAGTGLGQAGVVWDGSRRRACASEGGHTSFSPTRPIEVELLEFLYRHFEHVSWERLVSGPGLERIYGFVLHRCGEERPGWLERAERDSDPAAAIVDAAGDRRCAAAAEAVELFVRLYGSAAGNLALTLKATGGVFLGGGIAPKVLNRENATVFLDGFLAKGRMRPLLESMPVNVILDPKIALRGAARAALITPPANRGGDRQAR
jgi:glucokinase